jgi:uncharacterized protein with GYD domain
MPLYQFEVNFTAEGLRGVLAHGGTARQTVAEGAAESLGGTVQSYLWAFGATDLYVVADLPDNVAAAALALAVSAGGGAVARTVVLLTSAEIDAASGKQVGYRPPTS